MSLELSFSIHGRRPLWKDIFPEGFAREDSNVSMPHQVGVLYFPWSDDLTHCACSTKYVLPYPIVSFSFLQFVLFRATTIKVVYNTVLYSISQRPLWPSPSGSKAAWACRTPRSSAADRMWAALWSRTRFVRYCRLPTIYWCRNDRTRSSTTEIAASFPIEAPRRCETWLFLWRWLHGDFFGENHGFLGENAEPL